MIKTQAIYNPLYLDKEHFIILITGGRGSGKSFNASTFIERLTFERSEDRATSSRASAWEIRIISLVSKTTQPCLPTGAKFF